MLDILLNLLKQDRVSSILKAESFGYKDLNIALVYYTSGNQYKVAQSYFTDTWIAKSLFGPDRREDGSIIVESLHDIAIISESDSPNFWRTYPAPTPEDLKRTYQQVAVTFEEVVKQFLKSYTKNIHATSFTLTPEPLLLVTMVSDGKFLGVISIDCREEVKIVSKTSNELESLVHNIKGEKEKSSKCKMMLLG